MSIRKVGSMPQDKWDTTPIAADRMTSDEFCPKCGAEMEPIDSSPEGPPLEHLQLCPGCYLVTWTDQHGTQVRQGVPVKRDLDANPSWATSNASKC